jgi:two-component system sensor histidine kinase SenX3
VSYPEDQISALKQILDVLPDAAAVVDATDIVVASSSNCVAMGIITSDRLAPVELRALNREAHRTGKTVSRDATISRTGDAMGDWEARLQVSPLESGYSLVLAQDLSEERRLNDVRRDFVANVSHELKTPVGALSLLAEAVQAADQDIAQARHFAARMQLEVRRLTDLIADLVELSRVQGDAPLRNSKPVPVQDIVAEAVDSMKIAAEKRGIQVNVAPDIAVGSIFGDEAQLVTALRNLVSNAINYSPEGTKVGVGVRREDDFIELTVTDQGPGISEIDQTRIFERFYRVDPARSRETGGTGLGLAIVKHVCANHGGDCTVWSRLGEGSTFTLQFPVYNSPQNQEIGGK